MAEIAPLLLVALSGRALAVAAHRAGRRAFALDLFGDSDTRQSATDSRIVAGDLSQGFDGAALLAAADELDPAGASAVVYGSGFEARPDLLAALCRRRRLFGNAPSVLARIKDPGDFFPLLDRLDLPHPAVTLEPPADASGWLVKRIGGAGGSHVRAATAAASPPGGHYYQRCVTGRAVSALFAADGQRARLLGFSEQWPSPDDADDGFRFGGAAQPAILPPRVASAIAAALNPIVHATGLVGLNSIDTMVDGDRVAIIEINPRPGAALDIFDGGGQQALLGLHLAACDGDLTPAWQPPPAATAMSVVYALRPLVVPADPFWPGWMADRPAPGAHIAAGAPICTVMATAGTAAAARSLALRRKDLILRTLAEGDLSDLRSQQCGPEPPRQERVTS